MKLNALLTRVGSEESLDKSLRRVTTFSLRPSFLLYTLRFLHIFWPYLSLSTSLFVYRKHPNILYPQLRCVFAQAVNIVTTCIRPKGDSHNIMPPLVLIDLYMVSFFHKFKWLIHFRWQGKMNHLAQS